MVDSVCSQRLEVAYLFMATLKLSGLWSFYGKLYSKTLFHITDNLLYLLTLQNSGVCG
jgi:hypothetical protein